MKAWRFQFGMLLAAGVVGLARAQPELDVRAAFDRLLEAGNYSWDQSQEFRSEPSASNRMHRSTQFGTGETEIDGYTAARIWRRQVVLKGTQAVLQLNNGWRHTHDLTDDEIAEFSRPPLAASLSGVEQPGLPSDRRAVETERARRYTYAVPHEVLGLLLQNASNFKGAGGAVAADLVVTDEGMSRLETYLSTGMLPPKRSSQTGRPPAQGRHATLSVKFNAKGIVEFSVEFVNSGGNGQRVQTYTTNLFKVGTTSVDVAPEVKALFLDVAGGR